MSIQHLAALAVRITGVILLVKTLEVFVTIILSGTSGSMFTTSGLPLLGVQLLWFAAAIVMLAAPLRIAGVLGTAPVADADEVPQEAVSAQTLLQIVVIGAGLYFFVDAAKAFFSFLFYFIAYFAQGTGHGLAPVKFWQSSVFSQLGMGLVSFVASLWFLFGTRGIVRFIQRLRRA